MTPTNTKAARRLRAQLITGTELGWVRHLPEVGDPITRQVDDYQKLCEQYLESMDRAAAIKYELEALATHTQLLVDTDWTPDEQQQANQEWLASTRAQHEK